MIIESPVCWLSLCRVGGGSDVSECVRSTFEEADWQTNLFHTLD